MMAKKRPGRRNYTAAVLDAIDQQARRAPRPSSEAIHQSLEAQFPKWPVPSARLIRDLVAAIPPSDPGDPWSVATADLATIALVLPVLTTGDPITRADADMICRIRVGAPDLPLAAVHLFARTYVARVSRGAPANDVDLFLAFAPWRGDNNLRGYLTAIARDAMGTTLIDHLFAAMDFAGSVSPEVRHSNWSALSDVDRDLRLAAEEIERVWGDITERAYYATTQAAPPEHINELVGPTTPKAKRRGATK